MATDNITDEVRDKSQHVERLIRFEKETAAKLRPIHDPLYGQMDYKEHSRLLEVLGDIHLERAKLECDNDLYLKAANDLYLKAANLYKRAILLIDTLDHKDAKNVPDTLSIVSSLNFKLKVTCEIFCSFNQIDGKVNALEEIAAYAKSQLNILREYTESELDQILVELPAYNVFEDLPRETRIQQAKPRGEAIMELSDFI